jgi:hypothetical protein
MIVRIRCTLSTCAWSHATAATDHVLAAGPDPAYWTAETWTVLADKLGLDYSIAQVVDAHLATHVPHEWMTEVRRLRNAAQPSRIPSRADVHATLHTAPDQEGPRA